MPRVGGLERNRGIADEAGPRAEARALVIRDVGDAGVEAWVMEMRCSSALRLDLICR